MPCKEVSPLRESYSPSAELYTAFPRLLIDSKRPSPTFRQAQQTMKLPAISHLLAFLVAGITLTEASPVPYPDDLLEEINSLRLSGLSEVTSPKDVPWLSLLIPADSRPPSFQDEIATHFPRYHSAPFIPPLDHATPFPTSPFSWKAEKPGRVHHLLVTLSSILGVSRFEEETVETLFDLGNGEEWPYNGRSRLRESVGRRGEEMGQRVAEET